MHGYIKLFKKIIDWEWYQDILTARLFFHLLIRANYKDQMWRGKLVPKGSLWTSESTLVSETGLTRQQLRKRLSDLKSTGEITIKTTRSGTPKGSMISITNWALYQFDNQENNQDSTRETTRETTNESTRETTRNKDGYKHLNSSTYEHFEELNNQGNNQQTTRETTGETTNTKKRRRKEEKKLKKTTQKKSAALSPSADDSRESKKLSPKFSRQHFELAEAMSELGKDKRPKQKIKIELWADEVRKLEKIDGHSIEEIAAVWNWLHGENGNDFWRRIILSPAKLRKRDPDGVVYFERMKFEMVSESRKLRPRRKETPGERQKRIVMEKRRRRAEARTIN